MVARLLALVLMALVLAACADVPDDASPSSEAASPTPSLRPNAAATEPPAPSSTTAAASPTPQRTPVSTPAPAPRAIGEPEGSTGLRDGLEAGPRVDPQCLSGQGQAFAQAAPLPPAQLPDVSVYPGPYVPLPLVPDAKLQAALSGVVGDQAGSYAFFVKDLESGRAAVHNGARVFNAASLFKLFVMYGVFHLESKGAIEWQDDLVVTPYYDSFALSPRVTELCQVLTVAEAMDAMLSVSDNAAAVLLQDLVGSSTVNAAIEALGLQDSGLFEDGLPVTANDLALLMEAIATGEAVGPEASADMVRLLDHDVFENGLLGGLPGGTMVARKTGNWADATHVAGIVYAPWGPYVFVALTSNGYETAVIEALSRTAYEYLAEVHGDAH